MRRALPVVLALVLAACVSSDPPAADDARDAALGDETPADTPGDPAAGDPTPVDPATQARLQAILDEYLVFAREPGLSLAVRMNGDGMWGGAGGVADLVAAKPMEFDSAFRVGSNTKPYVVVAVLQLAEEGRLAIDDPISKHVPGYPAWGDITLRQLMGMRSGVPDYLSDFAFWADVLADPGRTFAPADLLGYVSKKPLDFAPGQGCAYSN
ncbi:MAG: beta-lactamase family protein, partial [Deltaproteobacteria bacterium]|nr:beta-lactamase family protein [Deltaproteobacteria bacterium]